MIFLEFRGGLGNQMFQYAFKKKLEKFYREEICFDLLMYDENSPHNGFELFDIFNIKSEKVLQKNKKNKIYKILRKLKNSIRKRIMLENNKNIKIISEPMVELLDFASIDYDVENIKYIGYWQSENYFLDIREEILKDFTFKRELDIENNKILEKIKKENSVSLHIRRGDYLDYPDIYEIQDLEYYKNAIKKIQKNIENCYFFIFSNDIDWCEKNLNEILGENYYFVKNNKKSKSYIDMQLMSECKHNIIANSTFSWWGAWLNENKDKIVIAPKKWYKKECRISSDYIIPDNWIKL